MHDDGVGLGDAQLVLVETVEVVVLARRRDHAAAGALVLQAQQLGEIELSVDAILPRDVVGLLGQAGHQLVAQFQLEFLVETVGQLAADALLQILAA